VSLVVVFDTNGLFSAIGWGGKPAACLRLARQRLIEGVTCPEILHELADKLSDKLDYPARRVNEVVGSLELFLCPTIITGELTGVCSDPGDDKILECARVSAATHIVSGDKKHLLRLQKFQNILIVSPAQLLAQWK
jgi:putative PIN family toxin of toxin-antitoxin system